MQGPIGVDNSEVINLEMELDLKRKHRHLQAKSHGPAGEESDDSENLPEDERENCQNEKLLNRLYKAADLDKEQHQVRFANQENQAQNYEDGQGAGVIDKQNQALIAHAKMHKKKVTHEEWIRSKEHQQSLREVLIHEAKRDTYEKLMMK